MNSAEKYFRVFPYVQASATVLTSGVTGGGAECPQRLLTGKSLLGVPKWEFSTGKKFFTPGKKSGKWLCPPQKNLPVTPLVLTCPFCLDVTFCFVLFLIWSVFFVNIFFVGDCKKYQAFAFCCICSLFFWFLIIIVLFDFVILMEIDKLNWNWTYCYRWLYSYFRIPLDISVSGWPHCQLQFSSAVIYQNIFQHWKIKPDINRIIIIILASAIYHFLDGQQRYFGDANTLICFYT